jgi:Sulfite exporter TauE/SafE
LGNSVNENTGAALRSARAVFDSFRDRSVYDPRFFYAPFPSGGAIRAERLFVMDRRRDRLPISRGIYGGYFGAGIGILMLATLGGLGLDHIHEMNAVKGVLAFLINGVAAVYFIGKGLIEWPAPEAELRSKSKPTLLFALWRFVRLLHERLYPLEFLLKSSRKIVRAVLKKNDKAEG